MTATGAVRGGFMLAFGEVQTGLLQNSTALSRLRTQQVLDVLVGETVRRSERPIAYAVSPDRLDGVDCLLPTGSGSRTRGIGTVVSHAVVVGGHVAQGSSYARLQSAAGTRRLPWSHYLAHPGRIETIGKSGQRNLAEGALGPPANAETLDVGAIAGRMLDTVQRSDLLDRDPPLRAPRIRLRWSCVLSEQGTAKPPAAAFTVVSDEARTLELHVPGTDLGAIVALAEDLALHDWLLTTLLAMLDAALTSNRDRADKIARLRPAIDHLLHLWMPAARVTGELMTVWQELERRPGFSRQWDASVTRVRDQLAISTLALLEASGNA